jgi:hypothetical protein
MTDYNEEGLRRLVHYIIVAAVDDYTEMQWSEKRWRFERQLVPERRKESAKQFLYSPRSSLSLCCNILGACPDRIREGAESRFNHDIPKRCRKNQAI